MIVDGEEKQLAEIRWDTDLSRFETLTPEEAEAIADLIVRIPELLEIEAERARASPQHPVVMLTEEDGHFHILRDSDGVLQRSRPFESQAAACDACEVWYGCKPILAVDNPSSDDV